MTETQAELRSERIAIMTVEGESETAAVSYCDSTPYLHGLREQEEQQETFFNIFSKRH